MQDNPIVILFTAPSPACLAWRGLQLVAWECHLVAVVLQHRYSRYCCYCCYKVRC